NNFCQYDFAMPAENVASDNATHFTSPVSAIASGTPSAAGPTLSGSPADGAVDLNWTAVGGATSYRVTSNIGPCTGGCNVGNVLTHHITGLTNGTAYTFTVAAPIGPGGPFPAGAHPGPLPPHRALVHPTHHHARPHRTV